MLEIKDLNVCYGAIHALKGLSLTVGEGELVSLIGTRGRQDHHAPHHLRPSSCAVRLHDAVRA